MASEIFSGRVISEIVEVRFASSGKLTNLYKKLGDFVIRGEIIARLDKKLLQLELDQKLSNNRLARAAFDSGKGIKSVLQAELDTSVREVEQAKYRLDLADLLSPADGQIIDLGANTVGLNITPSANAIKIILSPPIFRIQIKPEKVQLFNNPAAELPIDLPKLGKKLFAKPSSAYPNEKLEYFVDFPIPRSNEIIVGTEGTVTI